MLKPKSTNDYARPCKGSQLMGCQEIANRPEWPKAKGHAPRLAGLKGCATGRKNAEGQDVRESGPTQEAVE